MMNTGKTRPIAPVPKRTNGFSIDSIIGKPVGVRSATPSDDSDQGGDEPHGMTSGSPLTEAHAMLGFGSRLPPLHPALPTHVQQLLLNDPTGRVNQELLALRSQVWAFGNQQLGAFPVLGSGTGLAGLNAGHQTLPGMPVYGQGLHPGLVGSHGRDPVAAMYPWMLARQGASMAGLPYGPPDGGGSGFFFQPYRKPKRIRTAFSPSQLLRLEQAFEKNHYVVGQERKDLASKLNLTETQVKVWFQNRRTKHKRVRSDDEDGEPEHLSLEDIEVDSVTDVEHEHL